jgi:hypothetical protein
MEKKTPAVQIRESIPVPSDPSIGIFTVRVDLNRPAEIAKDFRRVLRDCPAAPARAVHPKQYEALTLVQEKGLSLRAATLRVFGNPGKKSALGRLRASFLNAAVTNAKH